MINITLALFNRKAQIDIIAELTDYSFEMKDDYLFKSLKYDLAERFVKKNLIRLFGLIIFEIIFTIGVCIDVSNLAPLIIYTSYSLRIRSIQYIYYVNLVLFRLERLKFFLRKVLEGNRKYNLNDDFLYEFLSSIKDEYQKLLIISQNINKCFGLSLIPIMIGFLTNLTAHAYWQSIEILHNNGHEVNLGNNKIYKMV